MSEQIRPDQQQKPAEWGTPGRAKQWGLAALSVFLLGVILVGVNLLVRSRYHRFDLTSERAFELDDSTVKRLEALDVEVTIYLTGPDQQAAAADRSLNLAWQKTRMLCQEFQKRSPKIKVVEVTEDMAVIDEIKRHFKEPQPNTIYVLGHLGGDNFGRKALVVAKGSFYDGDPTTGKIFNFHGERWLLASVNAVTTTRVQVAYSLIGHEEMTVQTGLQRLQMILSERESIEFRPLPLREAGRVPDDADLIFVLWPKATPSPAEFDALKDYLLRGGRLFVALYPGAASGFDTFLEDYGVKVGKGFLCDRRENMNNQISNLRIQRFGAHEINAGMQNLNYAFTMPMTGVIERKENPAPHLTVTGLMGSGPESWEESGSANQPRANPDPGERMGEMPVAQAVAVRLAKATRDNRTDARLVVWGSAYALHDLNLLWPSNVEYVLNNVRWLTGREELIADIKPKRPSQRPMDIPESAMKRIKWVSIGGFPALGILVGIVAWFIRRK